MQTYIAVIDVNKFRIPSSEKKMICKYSGGQEFFKFVVIRSIIHAKSGPLAHSIF